MAEPTIVPRSDHNLSRSAIDPDALKVLGRLRQGDHVAYLVGGSVRDLLLERRPKDFDIGTSAHPHEVKRLFRNCWIIGRRFRLVHVKFGTKTIEVATFRRQLSEQEVAEQEAAALEAAEQAEAQEPGRRDRPHVHPRDNTFGTPEEDAFRRDFTVNALFYDIATFSVIDYTGGLHDLRAGSIRSIGDPNVRFEEDPVRMLRAVVLAARLDFTIDPETVAAIRHHASLIAKASQARLLDEFYKILRSGASERAFHQLAEVGLLEHLAPELMQDRGQALWPSLAALDAYRHRFEAMPESLTNAMLLGTLLVPHGLQCRPASPALRGRRPSRSASPRPARPHASCRAATSSGCDRFWRCSARLLDLEASPRGAAAPCCTAVRFSEAADLARHPRAGARGARALERIREATVLPQEVVDADPQRRRRRRRGRGRRRPPPAS